MRHVVYRKIQNNVFPRNHGLGDTKVSIDF